MKKYLFFTALLFLVFGSPVQAETITIDPGTTFQTMVGWEAVAQAGQTACTGFQTYKDSLYDQAVNDLGINRIRLESRIPSGSTTLNYTGEVFPSTRDILVPLRSRLQARGESLWVTLSVIDNGFGNNSANFANQVKTIFDNMQRDFGFVPDGLEINEPAASDWNVSEAARALLAAAQLLQQSGYPAYIIAPSSHCGAEIAMNEFNQQVNAVPLLKNYVKEFSYHRYCFPSDAVLTQVANQGTVHNIPGLKTAMLEHGGEKYPALHSDLKIANVSAWEQFTLAFCGTDPQYDGYAYYDVTGTSFTMNSRTPYLRQYFKYIRRDAVRIGATIPNCGNNQSCSGAIDPMAITNKAGSPVAGVKSAGGATFTVNNLPNGTYGITYWNGSTIARPDQAVTSGTLTTSISGDGVITIYGKPVSTPVTRQLLLQNWFTAIFDQNGDGVVNSFDFALVP